MSGRRTSIVRSGTAVLILCAMCALGGVLAAGSSARSARPKRAHAHKSGHACHRTHGHRCAHKHRKRHKAKHGSSRRSHTLAKTPSGAAGSGSSGSPSGSSTGLGAPPVAVSPVGGEPTVPGAPLPARVQVTAREYSVTLSRSVVPVGPVVIEFVDRGQDAHNLHLASGGSEAGGFPSTEAGSHASLRFEMRAGSYELFCSLANHEALGMKATLTVQ